MARLTVDRRLIGERVRAAKVSGDDVVDLVSAWPAADVADALVAAKDDAAVLLLLGP
jgi:hypothetical protein